MTRRSTQQSRIGRWKSDVDAFARNLILFLNLSRSSSVIVPSVSTNFSKYAWRSSRSHSSISCTFHRCSGTAQFPTLTGRLSRQCTLFTTLTFFLIFRPFPKTALAARWSLRSVRASSSSGSSPGAGAGASAAGLSSTAPSGGGASFASAAGAAVLASSSAAPFASAGSAAWAPSALLSSAFVSGGAAASAIAASMASRRRLPRAWTGFPLPAGAAFCVHGPSH